MKLTLRTKIVSGFLVAAVAAVSVGLVGSHLVSKTHDNDERSARQNLQRVVAVSNTQVSLLMGEVFGSGLLIYGRNDALLTEMVKASKATSSGLLALGHDHLSPAARALQSKLVTSHSALVGLENNVFGLTLPVPDPNVPALKLENMADLQGIQTTIAQTAEGLREQITKDAARARDATTADAENQIRLLLWIVGAVGLGILAFGVWLSGRLVRRVRETVKILGRVAEGDLTPRFQGGGHDEVGEMAAALNTTLGTVHDVMCQLDADADELSAFAEQASEESATASAAVNQMSGFVRTIRSNSAGMLEHADRLASLVEGGAAFGPAGSAELAREIEELAKQARAVEQGLGDRGLGRAADASAVVVARNRAAADRLAEMAGSLNAMIGLFVIEPDRSEPTVTA